MRTRLTLYGQKCREFRTRYDLVMADQAVGLGISVAYISAIELGKRPIPPDYTANLAHWMSLSEDDFKQLRDIEIGETRAVALVPKTFEQATLAHEFSETVEDISREGVDFLRVCLAMTRSAKNPYSEIRKRAMLASAVFNLDVDSTFDVLRVVENMLPLVDKDFSIQVEPARPGQSLAYADSDGKKVDRIVLSDWFYSEASRQTPLSRAHLAHEIAHWILHPYEPHSYSRKKHSIRSKTISIEVEADTFAREFLLPLEIVERFSSPKELAKGANVPIWMAERRFLEIERLTKAEREQLAALGREISAKVQGPSATSNRPEATAQSSTSPLANLPGAGISRRRTRRKTAQAGMTLFQYADLKESIGTRSDAWFGNYGYRG